MIYDLCDKIILHDGTKTEPFTNDGKAKLRRTVSAYENLAMRTLALAYRDFDDVPSEGWKHKKGDKLSCETELTLIGVVGIEDPLRPDVPRVKHGRSKIS